MYFIYSALYFVTIIAFFYVLLQFTKFQSLSKIYVGWNKASEKLPFLNSTFGKIVALILIAVLSKSVETKKADADAYVAEAPAKAPVASAPPVNTENAWQAEFFRAVKEYSRKTSLLDNPELMKNRTRSEQEEYDKVVATGKAAIENVKGKTLNDQLCWYLGRQNIADTELWCYDSSYSPNFLFKIKLSEADAKKIGQLYKDDKFIFSGTVGEIELEPISYSGGNVRKDPTTIKITAISIEPTK